MEKYKRPSKAQITALALTMVMAGGGAYGVMSAANNANAQTNGATEFTTREENAEKFEKKETAETSLTVGLAAKVTQAALKEVPGGTVKEVSAEDGGYEAEVIRADGTEVEIEFDANFNVTTVETDDDTEEDESSEVSEID